MPKYRYQGRDASGKKSGKIQADSKRDALNKLRERGIRTTSIEQIKETFLTKNISIGKPVKLREYVIFLRQFATLLKAGVSVVNSVSILAEQTSSKELTSALFAIGDELRSGIPFSAAASKFPKIFPTLFISMMKAGEASGDMDGTLERLAVHYEKQHKTRQKIKSALAYPVTVGIIAFVVVGFLLVKVVPTFVDMFDSFDAELPGITLFVLGSSEFMQKYWYLFLILAVLMFAAHRLLMSIAATRYWLHLLLLKTPLFGGLAQKAAIARMSRTLSSLFASSVPILKALSIVEDVVDNDVIKKALEQSRESLEKGVSMAEPLKKHWAFPPLVTQMIAIGEKTGSLDEMLNKVAVFYEDEVDHSADQLKSLIEPVMIVLLSGLVGTIVIAIIIPMFDIYNQINP